MSSILSFPCFHPSSETWDSYIIRFDCFLDAADLSEISNHRKKAYFLSFCGAMVFDTATALLVPQTVKAVSWEDLQELLSNHYSPKPSRIAKRHAFRRRVQAEGETISTYKAALQKAALHSKMSILSAAEIQGSNSNAGTKPSAPGHYEDIFPDEISETGEDVNCLRGQPPPQKKNWIPDNKPMQPQTTCMSCGGNHLRSTCQFRNVVCLKCQRKGHLARVCKSGRNFNQQYQPQIRPQKQKEECFTITRASYNS
ncbi:hypothetical protein E2320_001973, partial [Naja naja]